MDQQWWDKYGGIAFAKKGRVRETGLDCWGLARLIQKEQCGNELPSLAGDYDDESDGTHLAEIVARQEENWQKVDLPRSGDLVLFRVLGEPHVGIVTEPGKFIHVQEGGTTVIEYVDSAMWRKRFRGYYRYCAKSVPIQYSAVAHPLKSARVEGMVPAGRTITQLVEHLKTEQRVSPDMPYSATVWVNGREIEPEMWDHMIPAPGSRIEVRAVARGSGVGRLIALVAVMIVAWYLAPYVAGAALGVPTLLVAPGAIAVAQTAITAVGMLLVNSIFPVRMPDAGNAGSPARQLLLQGGQNQGNPYGAIPAVLGRMRYTAPLGAKGYVESDATTSYLRTVLVWGIGPLQVSDLRLGDVPLANYEEVEVETLNGEAGESKTRFNSLYGKDVEQLSPQAEMLCERFSVSSASRSSDVVTVTTTTDNTYSLNMTATVANASGSTLAEGVITEIVNSKTFKFADVGADGPLASPTIVRASAWMEYQLDEEIDQLKATFHFPIGLRQSPVEGGNAGDVDPAAFRAKMQYRQLDSDTLAPITDWGDFDKKVAGKSINLAAAWFNTDSDAQLEKVYQWTRISVDEHSKLIVRTGAMSASSSSNPTGTLLQRLQNENFGLNVTFERLPAIGDGEELLWDICVYGNDIVTTTDRRDSSITGLSLTTSGRKVTLASGEVTRASSENIRLGASGEPFAKRKDAFTYNVTVNVTRGKYQMRVRRTNESNNDFKYPSGNSGQRSHSAFVQTITGYSSTRPVSPPVPLAMTAMRVKATNQINGNIDGVTATVQSICLDYDVASLSWIERPTRNPASLLRYLLQHPANAKRVADSKIDIPAFVDFHNFCRINGFMFDAIVTDQRSLPDVMRDVAAAGRASPTMRDGKHSVIIDKPRTSIAQYFTPHNSWGFESTRALPQLPHAFRVQFNNAEKSYQPDERVVYNDGYSVANATLFEGLQLPGVTIPATIFKHARFHFAQAKLRPEQYILNVDIEHLVCTRGDLVHVTHDVPMWGLGSGRIKEQIGVSGVVLDEAMPMKAGVQYTIRIRTELGTSVTKTVVAKPADGYYDTISFTTDLAFSTQGKPGNLFMFGELNSESVELIVQSIEPSDNMTARLTLVDYSPAVYDSDSEVIPDWDSQITLPSDILQKRVTQKPTITSMISDESIMLRTPDGGYNYGLQVSWSDPTNLPSLVNGIQAEIDYANDGKEVWQGTQTVMLGSKSVTFRDLREGEEYVVRLRYVDRDGRAGPWVQSATHTVVGKQTPPKTVTGISLVPDDSGTRMILSWDANAEIDIGGYEVRTSDAGWGSDGFLFKGDATQLVVTPPKTPSGNITWYVRAFDQARLYSLVSAEVSFGKSSVPPVTGLAYSVSASSSSTDRVTINWDDADPEFELSRYEVTLTLPDASTRVYSGKVSEWTTSFDWVGAASVSVVTVDRHEATSSAAVMGITKLVPSTVGAITKDVSRNYINLDWADVVQTTLPVDGYEVRTTDAGFGTSGYAYRGKGSQATNLKLASGVNNFYVRAFDTDSKYSAVSSLVSHTYSAPATPTGFTVQVHDNKYSMLLTWNANTEKDVVGYEIRTADSGWGTAGYLFRGLATERVATAPKVVGTSTTWYIKAIDSDGLYSTAAASVTYTKTAVPTPGGLVSSVSSSSTTTDRITYNWTDVSPIFGLQQYEVNLTLPDTSVRTYVGKTSEWTTSFNWVGTATLSVQAVDGHGSKSPAATLGKSKTTPNTVGAIVKTININRIDLDWDAVAKTTLPVAGYEVRTTDSGWGTSGYVYRGTGTIARGILMVIGTNTYYVRAFDTDGVYSAASATTSYSYTPPPDLVGLTYQFPSVGFIFVAQTSWFGAGEPDDFSHYEFRIKRGVTTGDVWLSYDTILRGKNASVYFAPTQLGTYRVSARMVDKDGNASVNSVSLNVVVNPPDPP